MPRGRKPHDGPRANRQREAWYAKHGIMPIDYMLGILRDERQPQKARMWAAQTAAPYCHPKLAQIDTRVWTQLNAEITANSIDASQMTMEERAFIREMVSRQAALAFARDDDDTIDGQLVTQAA